MNYQYLNNVQQDKIRNEQPMPTAQWIYNKGYAIIIKKGMYKNTYLLKHVRTGHEVVGTNLEALRQYLQEQEKADLNSNIG